MPGRPNFNLHQPNINPIRPKFHLQWPSFNPYRPNFNPNTHNFDPHRPKFNPKRPKPNQSDKVIRGYETPSDSVLHRFAVIVKVL